MSKPPADWITLSEAADLLAGANVRFRPGTIGRWARSGQLQSIKLGNRRYVRRNQVRALLRPPGSVHADEIQPGLFEDLEGWTEPARRNRTEVPGESGDGAG
jgi:hypothetical protein